LEGEYLPLNRRQSAPYSEQLYGHGVYRPPAQQYPYFPSGYQSNQQAATYNQYPVPPGRVPQVPFYAEAKPYPGVQQAHVPYLNPYPQPRPQQQQPSQFQNILAQFKKSNGQYDFNKLMDTAGQMMSTVNQMGSLAKGFTSFFKS
jgi:hypothetical protein